MKYGKWFFQFVIVLLLNNYVACAQDVITTSADTTLFGYPGEITYNYYQVDTLKCMHGNFSFVADNHQFSVQGNYENGKRSSNWKTYKKITDNDHYYILLLKEKYDNQSFESELLEMWTPLSVATHGEEADTNLATEYQITMCRINNKSLFGSYWQKKVNNQTHQFTTIQGKIKNEKFDGTIIEINGTAEDSSLIKKQEDYYYGNCQSISNDSLQLFVCELDTATIKTIVEEFSANSSQTDYLIGDAYYSISYNKRTISGFDAHLWELPDYRMFNTEISLTKIENNFLKTGEYRAMVEKQRLDSLRKIEIARLEALRQDSIRAEQHFQQRKKELEILTQQIVETHTQIKQQYQKDKKTRKLYSSYESVIEKCDVLKNDTSISYLSYLQEYASFQSHILTNLFHSELFDSIAKGKNEIIFNAAETFKPIADAYTKIYDSYDFTPNFSDISGYQNFILFLDTILLVQTQYQSVISIQQQVADKGNQILMSCSSSQKDIAESYKKLHNLSTLPPHFKDINDGKLYIQKCEDFIVIQQKYDTIIAKRTEIEQNNAAILANKQLKSIVKSYKIIYKLCNLTPEFVFLHAADEFIAYLDEVIRMQKRYQLVLAAPSNTNVNAQLKNVENPDEIKRIIGL